MPKYIITWNAGFGEDADVIEASDPSDAQKEAYQRWREDAEVNGDYGVLSYTADNCEELGLDFDDE